MAFQITTRADDDLLLCALAQRSAGLSSSEVAALHGMKSNRIRTMTNRVRDADLRCGDDPQEILKSYW